MMIAAHSPDPSEPFLWEFESGLATLSCHAAAEIDNVLLGRPEEPEALLRLVTYLGTTLPRPTDRRARTVLLEPVMFIIKGAIEATDPQKYNLADVDSLILAATNKRDQLAHLTGTLHQAEADTLRQMRSFCLAISERASAYEPAVHC